MSLKEYLAQKAEKESKLNMFVEYWHFFSSGVKGVLCRFLIQCLLEDSWLNGTKRSAYVKCLFYQVSRGLFYKIGEKLSTRYQRYKELLSNVPVHKNGIDNFSLNPLSPKPQNSV